MKLLSIVIPVLDSHEIVRRQVLHFEKLNLPDSVEVILVDDGSDPPLHTNSKAVRIIATHDKRPWTWAIARNFGAKHASGDYLLMTDIDYVLTRHCVDTALTFGGDKLRFRRELGVLTKEGQLTTDYNALRQYGVNEKRLSTKGRTLPPHPNNFAIRADLYWRIGGYREDLWDKPYPQGEDRKFKIAWNELVKQGLAKDHDYRPTIYMIPNGQYCGDVDANPFGLFHGLSRKTEQNYWYAQQRQGICR